MDPRDLEEYRVATHIRLNQVECTMESSRRGFPFRRLAKRFRNRTITAAELGILQDHLERISNKPISDVLHALY